MFTQLPKFRVCEAVQHDGLCVFPLFSEPAGDAAYLLADQALADGMVTVEEVSEAGSVPDLLVSNLGDVLVLFLEGQELVGAKQNRILNTSVLVAARTKLKIPVSCVERGRWRYSGRYFQASGAYPTAKLRHAVKKSVADAIDAKRGHRADQAEVWGKVGALHCSMGVESETAAMSDAFAAYEGEISQYRDRLKYVEGASGLAVAVGGRLVSVDFFDKPDTCQRVWDRLLSGLVFDALESDTAAQSASAADVEQLLAAAGDFPWQPVTAVGEGAEFRAESPRGDHASALLLDGAVVHGSVMPAV